MTRATILSMTAEAIKRLRLSLSLSQDAFASRLGVSRITINRWERGVSEPHPIFVNKMRGLK